MANLQVRFTEKGFLYETTFSLVKDGNAYYLQSADQKLKYAVVQNRDNNVFKFRDNPSFEENDDVIYSRLLGLSEEWMEYQSQGVEGDELLSESKDKPGYSTDDIYVENKPFSVNTIIELIKDGDLEVAPNFQRHFVWDRTRQSRLIESIFLGLPLPSIYLSQYSDGRLTIVDGLQRIRTINDFVNDELVLCNLEYFENCNGKRYSELKDVMPILQLRKFRQTQIMCFVIDYRSPIKLKYDLFRRLNTGGKTLNDQEIRNCLSRPSLQKILWKMITCPEFVKATGNGIKDTRMSAQEMALRYMYFYDQYTDDNPVGDYNGDMSDTLDDYVEVLNQKTYEELSLYLDAYKKALDFAYSLFGKNTFRRIDTSPESNKKYPINKSLMLAITVLLSQYEGIYKRHNSQIVEKMAQLLATDKKLSKIITTSTTDKNNILNTMRILKEQLFDLTLK